LLVVAFATTVARADVTLWIDDSAGNIGTVDLTTQTVTVIGNAGVVLTDIAFSPSGNLYGNSFTNLYSVSTTTGVATNIGATGVTDLNALVFGSNGTLYSAGAAPDTNLYTLNPSTGAATSLGSIGVSSAGDLAFHNGTLYLADTNGNLDSINLSPLSATVIGAFGSAFDASTYGLANGSNNVLYGIAGTEVFSVNTSTGVGTAVFNYGGHGLGDANGAAVLTEAGFTPVPEPSTFVIAGLGALGFMVYTCRRRKQIAG
jgi:hypothetical protein